ncbi:acyltransferase family protein [Rhodobacteraceae bacterium 2CG4]|uniref:Acyltransferase family protein n=1 Tax=Halovulum marinum TaxID=2662447 RepID=A0A6L5Z572_9RHOB|nr:acyltransferase [Halovulum marinum]MSU91706.1 acyltransferase family protein [Halovulum marinum]
MPALLGPGLVRLGLAMMVLVEHLSRFEIGSLAVMVFFTLSGYWVMRMFDESYRHMPRPLTTFYVSRFLRVWLLYVTVFLAAMAVLWGLGRYDPATWAALPILGVATHDRDIIGIAWSLDIELQFYALLPLLWAVAARLRDGAGWGLLALATLLLSAFSWVLLYRTGITLVTVYLPLFVAGAAIHLLRLRASSRLALLSVGAFVLAAVVVYLTPEARQLLIYGTDNPNHNKLFALLWAITLLPFVAWNVHQPSGPVDRHMGNLSYAIYLVHFPMIIAGRELVGRDLSDPEKLVVLVGAPVLALALYLLVDRRYERLRRRVVRALKTLPPPRRAAIIPIESAPMRESDSVQ